MELEKTYTPKPVEERWAKAWIDEGLYRVEPGDRSRETPFVVVIPPPNITGALHMGHALNDSLQDVVVRMRRMSGDVSLWVPGTDHGGIATQNVVEKLLKAEGKTRNDLGREKFLERMWNWRRECGDTILGQLTRMGCALDWSRKRFTMEDPCARAVYAAFERLWKKGVIYRGPRMINWCVRCGTALSDIEVEHEDRKGKLWHIHYPALDGSRGVVVATTRPETMLGDTAVAVHPDSEKWKGMIGKKVRLPLTGRDIPVVADASIDAGFGEGALKVTPAHDPVDFELGRKHNLPSVVVIGFDGKMTVDAGARYQGLSREKAREKVLEDLQADGLIEKIDDYPHSVPVCYRCQQVIEPLVSEQWFVKMGDLAAPAVHAAESGKVRFHPESWKGPFVEWLKGIKDWCISRQIWWGHRIPVWYCLTCNAGPLADMGLTPSDPVPNRVPPGAKGFFSLETPQKCAAGHSGPMMQDPDVLDTWFSSGLWPFSVFGWPEKTKDLEFFYPTSVLVTGYEIIYLWVARMVMMGLEFMGEVPFKDVYIHGIVRDRFGKKMSKSLGNVVDPLVLIEKFGTDAMRFALISQAVPGRDIQFGEESMVGPRNFANKLWNSSRFVLMNLPPTPERLVYKPEDLELADSWILSRYERTLEACAASARAYDLAAAAQGLYGFLWDEFCDWYIELAKLRLQGTDEKSKRTAQAVLVEILYGTLKLLHPFMPFITEELSQALRPYTAETETRLLRARLPSPRPALIDAASEARMGLLMAVTTAVRTIRSQFNVPPGLKVKAVASGSDKDAREALAGSSAYVAHLARLEALSVEANGGKPRHAATAVVQGLSIYVPLEGLIDFEKEKARLAKELEKMGKDIASLSNKLANEAFVSRAPKEEVDRVRATLSDAELKKRQLSDALRSLD